MLVNLALFFSIISVLIMIIILFKFKKLFSTDSIIEKTRDRMNKLIADINRNANNDIELLNESTRRIRVLLKDADEKMQSFNEATERLREMIAETEKLSKKSKIKRIAESAIYSDAQKKSVQEKSKQKKNVPHEKTFIDPNSSYEVTNNESLGALFDENDLVLKDETKVTAEGAAYKEVPLIITKVYDDNVALNANSDNSLGTKVSRMYANGMTVEEIALELDCSTSEVQFIIDMGL
ncbi:MAG: hypothetical protein PUJ82_11295 [Spirochaetales bacterium]|nr:hypothetical protein [Spirochaetales bacterium]MDY5913788.1 hypothetical protein [Treponema sp.]